MSTSATHEYIILPSRSQVPYQDTTVRGVRQDKRGSTFDRGALGQPAAVIKDTRSEGVSTPSSRSQKQFRERVVPVTLHVRISVKAEIQRLAASLSTQNEHMSVSKVGGALLEDAIRRDIQRQQEALLYPLIRQVIREELQAFGNRIVFFLMRIAFASEQSRILITNILDRLLIRMGKSEQTVAQLVKQSTRMARRNIIQKTPQMKSLLEEWEAEAGEKGGTKDA
jgi:hypothetical protein